MMSFEEINFILLLNYSFDTTKNRNKSNHKSLMLAYTLRSLPTPTQLQTMSLLLQASYMQTGFQNNYDDYSESRIQCCFNVFSNAYKDVRRYKCIFLSFPVNEHEHEYSS